MKISVITVCFNAASTIADTLRSVLQQTYREFEHIIIDGSSTDNTLEIIASVEGHTCRLVCEPDRGIYDAMNKGIALATGDIVGFLNADDFYAGSDVLSTIATVFADQFLDSCYGDLCYVSQKNAIKTVRYWRSEDFRPGAFSRSWCPPHPTFYVRRSIYNRHGGFDLSYKIAADFELMARYLERKKISTIYVPKVLVKMRLGGTTNRSFKNVLHQNQEIWRAVQDLKLKTSLFKFFVFKLFWKISQFFKHPKHEDTGDRR
ncbi:glycosyl transferase [Comamonadaceae bacterium]|nr:glycosyl transferase [Comamonadaceae bacterium]